MSLNLNIKVSFAIIIIIIMVWVSSCTENTRKDTERSSLEASADSNVVLKDKSTVLNIDLSTAGSLNYSNIFSKVLFITLTTPSGILVGKVDKFVEGDQYFFLKSNNKIFIFNRDGQYKAKIDNFGEAPNQYRAITDFNVDTVSNTVQILDNHSFSIHEFDYNGNYLTDWKHGLLSFQFYKLNTNKYLFYVDKELANSYNGRFLLYNKKMHKVEKFYLPVDRRRINYEGFLDVNNFFNFGSEVLLSASGNDTIFSLKPGGISPKYILDFGNAAIPNEFYEQNLKSVVEFNNKRIKNEYAGLYYVSFAENLNNMICQIVQGKMVYYVWYTKQKKSYYLIKSFKDDLALKGEKIDVNDTYPIYFGSREAIRVLEPELVIKSFENLQNSLTKTEWQNLLTSSEIMSLRKKITISSNPVIQILKYK